MVLFTLRPASAQVCGDADGSGAVTVTDGVQTLRAAAELDSACTVEACDIDGSGSITVTDGVGVLRKAAGLPVTDNCPSAAGQPATVLLELQAIFKYGVGFASGTPVTACANPPDGTLEVAVDEDGTTTSFDTCQVDAVELFGDIVVEPALLTFFVFEADTAGSEDFLSDYEGDLTLGTAGAGRSLNGELDVTTESAGIVTLTFTNATVAGGILTGGTATADLAASDIADAFTQLVFTFDGSGVANVVATQSNAGTVSFRYDIASGIATPS